MSEADEAELSESIVRGQKQRFIKERLRAATRTALERHRLFSYDDRLLAAASDQQIDELIDLLTRASAISGLIDEVHVGIAFREANPDLESEEPSEG